MLIKWLKLWLHFLNRSLILVRNITGSYQYVPTIALISCGSNLSSPSVKSMPKTANEGILVAPYLFLFWTVHFEICLFSKLQELHNSLKTIEFNSKEKYEREKYEMVHKQNELKKEHDEIKREFNQRLSEL